jgi:uncharacterized protein DUF1524
MLCFGIEDEGNLCLLTSVNRALGNKGFDRKREVFAESDLLLTRGVAEYEERNRQAVEKRKAYMPKLAAVYWRFNYSIFRIPG